MTRRALIIGVSGQDGSCLARLLLDEGYEVHGSSRLHETAAFPNLGRLGTRDQVRLHVAMPTDFSSMLSLLQRRPVDEIYNLSGQFIERTFAAVGLRAEEHVDADPGLARPSDITASVGDPSKARAVLGWRPESDMDAVIRNLVDAARAQARM